MNSTYKAFALCALGLERVLFRELEHLGIAPTGKQAGRVFFETDATGLLRANLWLRTAERVLVEAARFPAADFDALFEGAKAPEWERFLAREDRLVIERVRTRDSALSAQTSIQSIVHKAVYERLGAVYHLERLPETGNERSVRVYLEEDSCLIGIDTSGEALHKRGYRLAAGAAPLKETVAAGVLLLAGWNRRLPLLDPFCGSGTLLIEAAQFGIDRAPGLGRSFDLEAMPLAEAEAFAAERESARSRIKEDADLLIVGSDADEAVLETAKANVERAGLAGRVQFRKGRAEDATPIADTGCLITNPPYGERLGTEAEATELYTRLGELIPRFAGWGLGFVTNRSDFGEFFGRRAVSERKIMNGAEEQWFHWYPVGFETRPERAPRAKDDEDSGAERRHGAGKDLKRERPRAESREGGQKRFNFYGDRDGKPRSSPPRRPWVGPDKPGWISRPPRRDEEGSSSGDKKPYGERKPYGDRKHQGDRKPYGDRPSYGDRKPQGDRPSYSDRKPQGDRPSYGDRKPYGDRPADGERRPYGDRPRPPRADDRAPEAGRRERYVDFRAEREPRRDDGARPAPRYPRRDEGDRPAPRRPAEGGYARREEGQGDRPRYPRRDEGDRPAPRRPAEGGYARREEGQGDRPRYPRRDEGDRPAPRRPAEGSGGEERGKKPKVFRIEPAKRPPQAEAPRTEAPKRGRPAKTDPKPSAKRSNNVFGGERGPGRIDRNKDSDK